MLDLLKDIVIWMRTWRTLPIYSWIIAGKYYKNKDYKNAIKYYRKGLERYIHHPARFCAQLDLANCYFETGQFEEAEHILSSVTTYIPKSKTARYKLVHLQFWLGRYLDAAWTLRRAVSTFSNDPTFAGLYLIAILENDSYNFLLSEAVNIVSKLTDKERKNLLVQTARAKLTMYHGDKEVAINYLESILKNNNAPLEAYHITADYYINQGSIAKAKKILNKACSINNKHPKTLTLLAKAYLHSGPFYNEKYALQLAVKANQNSGWLSPEALHILAESYYHNNDIISSLLIANKARQEGKRLLGKYKNIDKLDSLIESLKEQLDYTELKDFVA